MTAPPEWRCQASDLPPGRTLKFTVAWGGRAVEGFVVNHDGAYGAYVNRCPHAGTTLDLWPNEFLSDDGRWLICSTHGAVFVPATGACLAGPCAGEGLTPLPVRVDGDTLVVSGLP